MPNSSSNLSSASGRGDSQVGAMSVNHNTSPHGQHGSLPQPAIPQHTSTAHGDWIAQLDTSSPLLADQIYGDQDNENRDRLSDASPQQQDRSMRARSDGQTEEDDAEEEEEDQEEHLRWAKSKVWYRRPDEKWLRPFAFLLALAGGMIMGPKVEMYYSLVCEEIGIAGLDMMNVLPPPQERPPVSTHCHKSIVAQSAQASLQLKLTIAMGLLSVITTGFWGGLSDRKGRIYVLRLAVLGLTINDIVFLVVGIFPQSSLPFGKDFLIVGAALEGCLGGFATLAASHQAYISDVTPNGTRAKIFSFFSGILFFGFAFGPGVGGWVSKVTNSLMTPFYFSLGAHVVYLLFTSFVLPESVSPERRQRAEDEYNKHWEELSESARSRSMLRNLSSTLLVPLRPLGLLLPHRRHDEKSAQSDEGAEHGSSSHISVSRTQRQRLDWNLTILALAYFVESMCMGIITPKINYAQYTFDWGVEELGYYLSFGSISRVLCLILIIPLVIKWWHKPMQGIALPHDGFAASSNEEGQDETRHLLDGEGRSLRLDGQYGSFSATTETPSSRQLEKLWSLRSRHLRQIHDSAFDKRLAIGSIVIDALCYSIFVIARGKGPVPYLIATALTSLGGAAAAAMSSLALALLESDSDAGKFFAAWSVLSAISTTVVGPVLFIELWKKTVSWFPETIFVVAFAFFLVAAATLCFVQVRKATSLPSLPPRPHTPASVSARRQSLQDSNGPINSTKSTIRLRPSNPFGRKS